MTFWIYLGLAIILSPFVAMFLIGISFGFGAIGMVIATIYATVSDSLHKKSRKPLTPSK